MTLTPRPYQLDAIARCREAYRSGARGVALVLPTGAGKTVVMVHVARLHLAAAPTNTIVGYCHRRELADQWSRKLYEAGLEVGPSHRVRILGVQKAVLSECVEPATLVMLDELHHFGLGAEKWAALPRSYADAYRLGATATPQRGDGSAIVGFDRLVVGITPAELTALGHLVPCDVLAPAVGLTMADPVAALQEYAPGRPTVVFCASVRHAQDVARQLCALGVRAVCVEGGMRARERDDAIAAYRDGRIDCLTNVFVLTEGFDATRAEVCVIARGCTAAGTWLQMIGRVLRPHSGKRRALVIDCRGSVYQHGLPTDERVWSLEGRAHALPKRLPALRQCPRCGGVARTSPVCPRCGYAFPPPEPPRVAHRELKVADPMALRASREEKRGYLARMRAEAREKNWKPKAAEMRFKARFGHWPDRSLYA